jgi:hypothetical protein
MDEEEDNEEDEDMDEEEDTDNVLTVSLSPDTPAAATIPGSVDGLPVAKFDVTAGSEDVTLTALTLKRRGLSDSSVITGLAVFTEDGRASKSKNDSQNNNTEAELTLTSGVVVKAGETRTLTVVADVASSSSVSGQEFAIELLDLVASSDVEGVENLVANTMKVGGVDAATLTVKTDSDVADVKVGEEGAEIFKFKVEGDNNEDVVLKSITFKADGSVDEEDELGNFKLMYDGEVVAETAAMTSKYLTFDLGDGVTIAEDKTEKFVVVADILGGAAKDIKFYVDKELDVSAEGTKYGYGAAIDISAVNTLIDTVLIDA